ncbi:MAG TPA: malate synthase G [Vicinamibacterales bacterium]|nr:malate synthase G [Vicinamibacterales bacterium]
MTDYITHGGIKIAQPLHALVRDEIAPGTGIAPEAAWTLLDTLVNTLGPRNRALLAKRDSLQAAIDTWLAARRGQPLEPKAMAAFLRDIGYLVPVGPAFQVTTTGVDAEIATLAGPQLVVPVDNPRYALNAANARWGSLYDALYGTNVIATDGGAEPGRGYNPVRGERVIARANQFLDEAAPLTGARWQDVTGLAITDGTLDCALQSGGKAALTNNAQFAGYRGTGSAVTNVLLRNHGLHIDIVIDRQHPIGQQHPAGVKDVVLEGALTTIMDCEDSVATVDAADKTVVYRNWCGIMRGTLTARFAKGGATVDRHLNPDREYTAANGSPLVLPGRSLLLVRHVGAHVLTDAVTDAAGQPIAETFLDCVITTLAALHDLQGRGKVRNTRAGSMYIVKPKQHGPEEVALSVELFAAVERAFGLPANTLKIGIMDEERRTTVNLKECIRVSRDRIIFINTGFLDRTGDELHTHMEAGPVMPKPEIKGARWIAAYEDWNVRVGLEVGLPGHGQIGKGMWAMPDEMRAMLETKQGHPKAGASCAWVPSPTAATLHAIHYHQVDVAARQKEIAKLGGATAELLDSILTPPLLTRQLNAVEIQRELDNNAQGILGYVVRWVEQGIGCSKVPDINDVGLMEDRATLRISSQHIANWLRHGIVDREQVLKTLQRMAEVVDRQNAGDPHYRDMAPAFERSVAFQAALDLVFNGLKEPNGYTEHALARRRREFKAKRA